MLIIFHSHLHLALHVLPLLSQLPFLLEGEQLGWVERKKALLTR